MKSNDLLFYLIVAFAVIFFGAIFYLTVLSRKARQAGGGGDDSEHVRSSKNFDSIINLPLPDNFNQDKLNYSDHDWS